MSLEQVETKISRFHLGFNLTLHPLASWSVVSIQQSINNKKWEDAIHRKSMKLPNESGTPTPQTLSVDSMEAAMIHARWLSCSAKLLPAIGQVL